MDHRKVQGCKALYDVRDIWPDVALEMGSLQKTVFTAKVFKSNHTLYVQTR